MDEARARTLIEAERAAVQRLLRDTSSAGQDDRTAEQDIGDSADSAQPLTTEGVDDAVAASLHERLAALDRAEERLTAGEYGKSLRSGRPIPDERLEANPAAEFTVDEAEATR
ncbi:MAG: hypothetical protein ABI808_03940 [Pseudonocardiales bacterium]